jgi:nitrile hydratase subunit beta
VNGIHDMGGMHGFGPIRPREHDEAFHAEWEKRVPGLSTVSALHGIYNIDESRHGIERMEPAQYLASTYYERHLFTIETNLVEKGVLSRDEIEARLQLLRRGDASAAARRDDPEMARRLVLARLANGVPPQPSDAPPPRFRAGDRVITRNVHSAGHTRLPRYARGKQGVVDRFYGVDTLPDASAHGRGPSPEPLYSVRFAAEELWGASADGQGSVYLDLWESYLLPIEEDSR